MISIPESIAKTKILATLGPATQDVQSIRNLIKVGVDGVRLNFSHGDLDFFKEYHQFINEKVADALIHCIDKNDVIRIDSGPWERHLPGKQYIYTSATASGGLKVYAELLNLAGNVSLYMNDLETAKSYFEKELVENPQSSTACYGLGQVFLEAEVNDAAKTMFEWSVKNDANNQKAVEALNKVNSLLGLELSHNTLLLEV